MTRLVGRRHPLLALSWLAGAGLVGLASSRPQRWTSVATSKDTIYVLAQNRHVMSLTAWFLVCGAIYLFLDIVGRQRYRRRLGLVHFLLTLAGSLLILSPRWMLRLSGAPQRYVEPASAFALWNAIVYAGYVMTLIGLAVFVVMLVDALVRGMRPWLNADSES